jgi:putative ABC transport system permease protein
LYGSKKAPILIGNMNYFKIALRIQARYKWFTLTNIAGLSLGILCSMLIFLYVSMHLDTDTHHPDGGRIYRVVLDIHTPAGGLEYEEGSALPMANALHDEYSQIESTARCMKFFSAPTLSIETEGGTDKYKEENVAAYADNDFLTLLGHNFIAGNKHTALTEPRSVVLSSRQALKYFGTTEVIGRLININNSTDLIVTGVLADQPTPSDLTFDVLVSLSTLKVLNPKYQDQNFTWIGSNNWTFVKIKDPDNAAAINAQLPAFVEKYLGADFNHWHFRLQPLADIHFDTRYDGVIHKTILWVLAAVATALVGLVCINYINLSIAQSTHRAKEIGVRKYRGGSKAQLFLQFMTETASMVLVAIVLALAAAYLMLPLLNTWLQTDLMLAQLATPGKVAILVAFVCALVFVAGYYPAVMLSGFDPIKAMTGRSARPGGTNQILRKSLICVQYTVALLFLISTVVIVNQVDFLLRQDGGFAKESVVTVALPKGNASRFQAFRDVVITIPGVASAALQNQAPIAATAEGGFVKYDNRTEWEDFIVRDRWADSNFIDTYHLHLAAGRNIVQHDSLTEAVVNEAFLRKLNITDPTEVLGKSIVLDNAGLTATIVGVVEDFHHRSLQHEIEPVAIYTLPGALNQVGIRLEPGQTDRTLEAITAAWKSTFPDDVLQFSFLDQSVSKMYRVEQITGKLMSIFAIVSGIICSIGIIGLSVFSALQRTKEIGIRKVLGATAWNILYLLCRQYMVLIMIALVIALPVAYIFMHRWLEGFAYHVSLGWAVFVVTAIVMVVVTLLLVGSQSLKTALTNPGESLKHE